MLGTSMQSRYVGDSAFVALMLILKGNDYEIEYSLNDKDKNTLATAAKILTDAFFDAGAKEVYIGKETIYSKSDIDKINPGYFDPFNIHLVGAHPQGTCRMGSDPKKSVTDSYGKLHGIKNMYIIDASIFPISIGINPQLTIMALSSQITDRILNSTPSI